MPIQRGHISRKGKKGEQNRNFFFCIKRESMENSIDSSLAIYLEITTNNLRREKVEAKLCKSIALYIVVANI